ncbi:MAG: serine hydrolase [Blastocatellia bacterium]|nr:serine hydrolase [Blastocatellia bacterium]
MTNQRRWLFATAAIFSFAALVQAARSDAGSVAERMRRVESGLSTGVTLAGQAPSLKLAERMAFYKVPGVSVAVINNGAIEWAKGYGVIEAGAAAPVTTETRFQAASISKPVAAMAALALVERGKLALDEDVNRKLVSWKIPEAEATKAEKVTLRRLVSHGAGLTVHGFRGYAEGEPVPTVVQVLDGQKPANSAAVRADLVPGTKWRYSGGGYTVMQLLLTDVTGKPFPDLMEELVLGKIGMRHSSYQQPLPKEREAVSAVGHRDGQFVKGKRHTYPEMAAAGLWTTPSDLARFAIELQQSLQGRSNKVLSQEMVRQMLTKQTGEFGLGLQLGGKEKVVSFSHGGSNEGFRCMLFAYLDSGKGAVVMTNGDRGGGLATEILRAISREYDWPDHRTVEKTPVKIDLADVGAFAGKYEVSGATLTVSVENGRLFILVPPIGPQKMEMLPLSATRFFVAEDAIEFNFAKNDQGAVTGMQVFTGAQPMSGKKLP